MAQPLPTAAAMAKAALTSAHLWETMAISFSDLNHNPSWDQNVPEHRRREAFVDLTKNILGITTLEVFKWGNIFVMLAEHQFHQYTSRQPGGKKHTD
jgi:hypothetical protein